MTARRKAEPEADPGESGYARGDKLIVCANCKRPGPFIEVILLRAPCVRKGRWVSVIVGAKLACQKCGEVFCADTEGSWAPHPQGDPRMRQPEAPAVQPQLRPGSDETFRPRPIPTLRP